MVLNSLEEQDTPQDTKFSLSVNKTFVDNVQGTIFILFNYEAVLG